MYTVTKTIHLRLPGGQSVVLQAGPRGMGSDPETGEPIDLDAKLKRALPGDVLRRLITNGTITES